MPTPDGAGVLWFHDATGDEFGHWVTAPFGGGPASIVAPDVPDGWPAGLSLRPGVMALAMGDREGFTAFVMIGGGPARVLMRHDDMLTIGGEAGRVGGRLDGRRRAQRAR